jgi:hypothetical protein
VTAVVVAGVEVPPPLHAASKSTDIGSTLKINLVILIYIFVPIYSLQNQFSAAKYYPHPPHATAGC